MSGLLVWEGEHVEVRAFVSFGRATVKGTGVSVRAVWDRLGAGEYMADIERDYGFADGQGTAAVNEWDKRKSAIRRAERDAAMYMQGWRDGRRDTPSHEEPEVPKETP